MSDQDLLDYVAICRVGAAYADIVTRRAWPELEVLFAPDATITVDTVTNAPIDTGSSFSITARSPMVASCPRVRFQGHEIRADGLTRAVGFTLAPNARRIFTRSPYQLWNVSAKSLAPHEAFDAMQTE